MAPFRLSSEAERNSHGDTPLWGSWQRLTKERENTLKRSERTNGCVPWRFPPFADAMLGCNSAKAEIVLKICEIVQGFGREKP